MVTQQSSAIGALEIAEKLDVRVQQWYCWDWEAGDTLRRCGLQQLLAECVRFLRGFRLRMEGSGAMWMCRMFLVWGSSMVELVCAEFLLFCSCREQSAAGYVEAASYMTLVWHMVQDFWHK
ncbi:hypothetical protein RYX36_015633 [Vicia faba]